MRSENMIVLTGQAKEESPGTIVYGIGDAAHKLSASGHNEDDTPGSRPEQEDPDTKPEHRAIDIMLGRTFTYAVAWLFVAAMVSLKVNQDRLLYVIFDGWIWRRNGGWRKEVYTGSDKHRDHVHLSGNWPDDDNRSRWVTRIPTAPAIPAKPATARSKEESVFYFTSNFDGKGPRWANVSPDQWIEYDQQDEGNAISAALGGVQMQAPGAVSATQLDPDLYTRMRAPYAAAGRVFSG